MSQDQQISLEKYIKAWGKPRMMWNEKGRQ